MNPTKKDIELLSSQLGSSDSIDLQPFLQCKDHTVSRETFTLFREADRDLLVTFPQPDKEQLPAYYESEDYISHTDSRRNPIEYLYQKVKEFSLKRKLRLIQRLNKGQGELLDVGCGTGDFLKTCMDAGWSVSGIEPNEKARRLAQAKISSYSCHSSIEELLEAKDKTYDLITLWHVLEHVPDLGDYIGHLKRLLKPEGSLVLAVPNFKSHDAEVYGEYWAAYDVPRHLWHFSRNSIKRIFSDFNLEVIEELPLPFDSFYVSLLSEKYKNGSQKFLSAFKTGLQSNLKARRSGEYSSVIYVIKRSK